MQRQQFLKFGDASVTLFRGYIQPEPRTHLLNLLTQNAPEYEKEFPYNEVNPLSDLFELYGDSLEKSRVYTHAAITEKISEKSYLGAYLFIFLSNAEVEFNCKLKANNQDFETKFEVGPGDLFVIRDYNAEFIFARTIVKNSNPGKHYLVLLKQYTKIPLRYVEDRTIYDIQNLEIEDFKELLRRYNIMMSPNSKDRRVLLEYVRKYMGNSFYKLREVPVRWEPIADPRFSIPENIRSKSGRAKNIEEIGIEALLTMAQERRILLPMGVTEEKAVRILTPYLGKRVYLPHKDTIEKYFRGKLKPKREFPLDSLVDLSNLA